MTPDLLKRLRREIEEDRDSAIAELHEYGADPEGESVEPIEGVDDNFADLAAATAERTEAYAMIDHARNRLAAAEQALAQMDEGAYGRCVDCGADIGEARLEARPLSVRCIDCAAQQ